MADADGERLGADNGMNRLGGARPGSDGASEARSRRSGRGPTGKEACRPDDQPSPRVALAAQIGSDWPFT
ncbi:hypothetical protein DFR50_11449 [Roseiarcus fermentans]|uniref:Uncharacterized protein n=1 Tax=Roseiarcus fermentans TaxID=1473586 RepID=A0A366FE49_9HYPH|nr:hypothetical protein [Roseiarcus fermentans]RBP12220.1 hypothetical protein DFR50_11449 [Roseiarcus fermentans]